MQSARQAFQASVDVIKESVEGNKQFQYVQVLLTCTAGWLTLYVRTMMMQELQAIKACMDSAAGNSPSSSTSGSSGPIRKSTSTRASDRKVERRVAKATGRELALTPEEIEDAARSKLQVRSRLIFWNSAVLNKRTPGARPRPYPSSARCARHIDAQGFRTPYRRGDRVVQEERR